MNQLPPIAPPLLEWYHANRRVLPFRENPTPYRIWVSEIMLQQTRVTAMLPYYARFIAELPDVAALAACDEEKLHKLWEGLGYYSRVRNMQKAAKIIMENHNGTMPPSYTALLGLPGIGEYTAGAIASIAFGLPVVAIDGNVLRVISRILASRKDIMLPATRKELGAQVQLRQPADAPGDYNQALMELGALVCTPGTPSCAECPLAPLCEAKRLGIAAELPCKPPKKPKEETALSVFVLHSGSEVLLHQRPPHGLLAGLWEPLLAEENLTPAQAAAWLQTLFPDASIIKPLPAARHIFTHRVWNMTGWMCSVPPGTQPPGPDYCFVSPDALQNTYTLPSAFRAYLPFLKNPSV